MFIKFKLPELLPFLAEFKYFLLISKLLINFVRRSDQKNQSHQSPLWNLKVVKSKTKKRSISNVVLNCKIYITELIKKAILKVLFFFISQLKLSYLN